jgi:hypothetical protein
MKAGLHAVERSWDPRGNSCHPAACPPNQGSRVDDGREDRFHIRTRKAHLQQAKPGRRTDKHRSRSWLTSEIMATPTLEERHLDTLHKPRVTPWMSTQGEVANPRQDLNPFLQLDADVANRRINVWEGDMVENQGTSRPTSPWVLSEVTRESTMERILDVLRRAGTHGVA